MGGDIGILEHADLVHSDGEDAMGHWFGELTGGRDTQFFPGPPIATRRRSGEHSCLLFGSTVNAPVSECCP